MWWEKKPQSEFPKPGPTIAARPQIAKVEKPMPETIRRESMATTASSVQAVIGRSIILKGELSANEDLLIEGQFEGAVNLQDHCLTVGTNGKVKAEINARQVVILGSVNGNVSAREKIEVRRSGNVIGDLTAASVSIEEGAYFKGSIDILREGKGEEPRIVAAASAFDNE